MPMAARADFSEKYLTPESGLPKAHNLSSILAFSNGQSPEQVLGTCCALPLALPFEGGRLKEGNGVQKPLSSSRVGQKLMFLAHRKTVR